MGAAARSLRRRRPRCRPARSQELRGDRLCRHDGHVRGLVRGGLGPPLRDLLFDLASNLRHGVRASVADAEQRQASRFARIVQEPITIAAFRPGVGRIVQFNRELYRAVTRLADHEIEVLRRNPVERSGPCRGIQPFRGRKDIGYPNLRENQAASVYGIGQYAVEGALRIRHELRRHPLAASAATELLPGQQLAKGDR